jgi:hypothetical protein
MLSFFIRTIGVSGLDESGDVWENFEDNEVLILKGGKLVWSLNVYKIACVGGLGSGETFKK